MNKYLSRKFIICVAAFLGSLGTSIAALHTDNEKVAAVGMVCTMIAAAIYAAAEAYVDGKTAVPTERIFDLEEDLDLDDDDEDIDEAEVEEVIADGEAE